ncbi:ATP-binding protein [Streptomyces sp. NPDC051320]|uniref:ATP-binding protein n=1 Tax=Streptomyces sp. NPDC051320 TaxID=3154644 RepID=UPI003420F6B1
MIVCVPSDADCYERANACHWAGVHATLRLHRKGAHFARVGATRTLAAWGYVSDDVALVVSELAANAVAHGRVPGRGFLLRLAVGPGCPAVLRIEVSDACGKRRPQPDPRMPESDAETGRGLLLVQAMALDWGVSERLYGKTVWARVQMEDRMRLSCGSSETAKLAAVDDRTGHGPLEMTEAGI